MQYFWVFSPRIKELKFLKLSTFFRSHHFVKNQNFDNSFDEYLYSFIDHRNFLDFFTLTIQIRDRDMVLTAGDHLWKKRFRKPPTGAVPYKILYSFKINYPPLQKKTRNFLNLKWRIVENFHLLSNIELKFQFLSHELNRFIIRLTALWVFLCI